MPQQNRAAKLFDGISGTLWVLAGIFLFLILCGVVADVVLRVLFPSRSLPWVMEVSEYLMFGITFLGGAHCLKKGGHIRIDFIFNMLNRRTRLTLALFTSMLGAVAFWTFSTFAGYATWYSFQKDTHLFKFLKIPKYVFTIVICFSTFIIGVELLRQGYKTIRVLRGRAEQVK